MPALPGTPEVLLARSDSKDPASTCSGLTANGRPCRRTIVQSAKASPTSSGRRGESLEASPGGFCWQHQDQIPTRSPQALKNTTIREQTSVDTLVNRLGILELDGHTRAKERRANGKPSQSSSQVPTSSSKPKRNAKRNLGLFCCIGIADDVKAPRPAGPTRAPVPSTSRVPRHKHSEKPSTVHQQVRDSQRPVFNRDPSSRTGELLSLIPPSISPQTTALLLAELAKPISVNDEEGYIYIFWLTPESLASEKPAETAPSLLTSPSRPAPGRRRTSEVLSAFSGSNASVTEKTILLKIGRAQNVHRRLNQWMKQCGHNLSLIRYYPYNPTIAPDLQVTPRKIPCVHKVERLIHIELAAKRAQGSGKCKVCGREHREWFEVHAHRDGVKAVDEVVRRWVSWGEKEGSR